MSLRILAVLAVLAMFSGVARAGVRVEYTGDACRAEVRARLDALADSPALVRVELREQAGGGVAATIAVGAAGIRKIEAATCADAASSIGLVVSMSLAVQATDAPAALPRAKSAKSSAPPKSAKSSAPTRGAATSSDAASRTNPDTGTTSPAGEPADPTAFTGANPENLDEMNSANSSAVPVRVAQATDSAMPAALVVEARREPSGAPFRMSMLAGGSASARGLFGAFLGGRLRRGEASLGIEGAFDAPDRVTVEGGGIATARRIAGTVAPCAHRGDFSACAALSVGRIAASGEGFANATSATQPYAAAGARLGWEYALTRGVALQVRAEANVALTTNRFLVDEMTVWRGARLDARLGLGIAAQVP